MQITVFAATDSAHGRELWRTDGTAAGTRLIRDLLPGVGSSNPDQFVTLTGVIYFLADTANGRQLWRTDGSAAGTYALTTSLTGATALAVVGNRLFYAGSDPVHGQGVYVSDGTAAGSVFLAQASGASLFTAVGDKLFFQASTSGSRAELWVSDGTADGTRLVKDIVPGLAGSAPDELTSFGGMLYFRTSDGVWRSDGTVAGTVLLAPGATDIDGVAGDRLILTGGGVTNRAVLASDGVSATQLQLLAPSSPTFSRGTFGGQVYVEEGYNLYATDGTVGGTRLVAPVGNDRIIASVSGGLLFTGQTGGQNGLFIATGGGTATFITGGNFTAAAVTLGGKAYFALESVLWVSDGTVAGSHALHSFNTMANLTVYQGQLLFSAADAGTSNTELWTSDGTAGGTHQVLRISPPTNSISLSVGVITPFGDKAVFDATLPNGGYDLPWITDGTAAGTFQLQSPDPIVWLASPPAVVVAGGKAYFTGSVYSGLQLFATSGGAPVEVTNPSNGFSTAAHNQPYFLSAYHDRLYFAGAPGIGIGGLYVTDGDAGSVTRIAGVSMSGQAVVLNDKMIFYGSTAQGSGLVASDGTTAGSVILANVGIALPPTGVIVSGNLGFFAGPSAGGPGFSAGELWVTDGTTAGTHLVAEIVPGTGGSSPWALTPMKGGVVFTANDGAHGTEVWFSDGTAAGTVLTGDINSGTASSNVTNLSTPATPVFAVLGGKAYFSANDGVHGQELWSAGNAAGSAQLVADLAPGTASSNPTGLTVLGGALYFIAKNGGGADQLWRYDPGAGAPTALTAAAGGQGPQYLTEVGSKLFFMEANGPTSTLMVSDGANVFSLAGFASLKGSTFTAIGGQLYFQGSDAINGAELWKSDGTAAGTLRVTDTQSGQSAAPAQLTVIDAPPGETLPDAYAHILRMAPTGAELSFVSTLAAQVSSGALTLPAAIAQIADRADATTSVATFSYEFFTGRIPSAAGLDYLVSPIGPNAANLNSAYYQGFNLENRYINFAVNLGKLGEGKAAFAAQYGVLSLFDATKAAYTTIFGAAPTDAKVHALIDTRVDYFAAYGLDGPAGIGTKAAMVGWLLAEAVKADVGAYATANDAFLADLADGVVNYAVDIVGVYGGTAYHG